VGAVDKLQLKAIDRHKRPDALANLSAILIDGDEVYVDNPAIHGKAKVERGIRFVKDADEVPNPRRVALVWATLRRAIQGHGLHGLGASVMYIDAEAGVGFKSLPDQVNKMDGAVKGRVQLEALNEREHALLGKFLMAQRDEIWENAVVSIWSQWQTPEQYEPMKLKQEELQAHRDLLAREATERAVDDPYSEPPE